MKILAVRTDGLGDLILTLPAFEALKKAFPGSKIDALVRDEFCVLTENFPFLDNTIPLSSAFNGSLKELKYDFSVMFHFDAKTAFRIFKTSKKRYGRLSKPFSFIILNKGLRQKRSHAEKNEVQYNIDLVRHALGSSFDEEPKPRVYFNLKETLLPFDDYVVISPQMKGSARNFDASIYEKAALILRDMDENAVLTGSESCGTSDNLKKILGKKCCDLTGKTCLRELGYVLAKSKLVIAPSTGTLHLANSLGKNVFSVYPSFGSTSFTRWHPWKYSGIILTCDQKNYPALTVPEKTLTESLKRLLE